MFVIRTDEDAKRALHFDGGYIKSVRITLMLSSQEELRKVYDYTQQKLKESEYLQLMRRVKNYSSIVDVDSYDFKQNRKPALCGQDSNTDYNIRPDRSRSPIIKVADGDLVELGCKQKFETSGGQFSGEVPTLPVNQRLHRPLLAFTPAPTQIMERQQTSSTPVCKRLGCNLKDTTRSMAQTRDHHPYPGVLPTTGGGLRHRLPAVITQPYPIRLQRYQRYAKSAAQ